MPYVSDRFHGYTVNHVYERLLASLQHARVVSPRGLATLDLFAATTSIGMSSARLLRIPGRRLNLAFACAEALWNLAGREDVEFVAAFNSQMRQFSDDGVTLRSCYGARARGLSHLSPNSADQLAGVVDTLNRDPSSRQAVVVYRVPGELDVATKDLTFHNNELRWFCEAQLYDDVRTITHGARGLANAVRHLERGDPSSPSAILNAAAKADLATARDQLDQSLRRLGDQPEEPDAERAALRACYAAGSVDPAGEIARALSVA